MIQVTFKAAGEMTAISHRHEHIYPRRPLIPALAYEASAQDRVLKDRGRDCYLWIDVSDMSRELAHVVFDLMQTIVIEKVAHVGWSTRYRPSIQQEIRLLSPVHLVPIGGQHRRVAPPVGFDARLRKLHAVTFCWSRLIAEHCVLRHMRQAVVTEAVANGRHIARITHVVMVNTINRIACGNFLKHRNQPLVHVARTLRRAHPRSEEHTSELQSRPHLVCRLLLEKKKKNENIQTIYKKKKQKKQ